ncbi:MAG TPA: DUF2306 domain-containing protein [Thermoanaerobaculia bacterium]|nr:DUF2306 domain-containing protein [Thermoanaerobaculia bacterium]
MLIHICGAVVGLLSGCLAMMLRKGSGLHAAAGNVFFISMLCMTSTGAYIAEFMRPNKANFLVAVLTFYLVSTAWVAARRRDGKPTLFDRIALLVVLADGIGGMIWGIQAAGSPRGLKDGMPAAIYFVFGSVALLCAVLDVRMIRRGGVAGAKRIVRHLLRMSFALLIALMSLYPGQAKLFPVWFRETNLMFVPHVLVIGSLLFWTVRMRRRSKRSTEGTVTREPSWQGAVSQRIASI